MRAAYEGSVLVTLRESVPTRLSRKPLVRRPELLASTPAVVANV